MKIYSLIWLLLPIQNIIFGQKAEKSKPIMLYQAVDDSFFSVWLNWWALALSLKAFPEGWILYLACFGDKDLEARVKLFHSPGCDQIIGGEVFIKHVYLAKWMAVTNAFKLGHDLMIMDVDSVLIRYTIDLTHLVCNLSKPRNPNLLLPINGGWDIIASRDHGPGNLPFSGNWGTGRLCTGFIFIKNSQAMLELVELVLRRCKRYGHDQIQFNSAIARNGVAWHAPPEIMNNDEFRHFGSFIWQHQYDIDFLGFNKNVDLQHNWTYLHSHNHKLESQGKSFANFSILMLARYDILRYCTSHPAETAISPKLTSNPQNKKHIIALHCFLNMGPVGEQGVKKKEQKTAVMKALDYWILKSNFNQFLPEAGKLASNPIFHNSTIIGDHSLLGRLIDQNTLRKTKKLWLLE